MGETPVARYWCYRCSEMVRPVMEVEIKCPFCEGGFVEEIDSRREPETDMGSDRALSLWAPILLGMMGGGPLRRRRFRRQSESEEDEEETRGESEQERDLELIIRRRRRNSSAILHLLQGLRGAGIVSEHENSENNRESEQERVILINPFNQAVILQGSSDVNQTQRQNQNIPGSLGDYLIGPGLDLLLQHLADNDPNRYGTPPTKKEALEAMPTVAIKENLQCSVCLDDLEIGAEAREMPCKHKFHSGCILPWLELHSSCPVCRFQMPADDGSKGNEDGSGDRGNRVETNGGGGGGGERSEGENRHGRRNWLPIPWPFNGLFSISGSQSENSSSSPPPPSSSSRSTYQTDEN